jgi:hypothetical protein
MSPPKQVRMANGVETGIITAFIIIIIISGVRMSPLGTATTVVLLYQRQIDDGDCGAIGGMKVCRENRSTGRNPAPVPLFELQIPHMT